MATGGTERWTGSAPAPALALETGNAGMSNPGTNMRKGDGTGVGGVSVSRPGSPRSKTEADTDELRTLHTSSLSNGKKRFRLLI